MGDVALARRLDRFLIKHPLLNSLECARQWVGHWGMSDHSPIYLEFECGTYKARSPFKFNARWLQDPDYHTLVSQAWQHCHLMPNLEPARIINDNLLRIKILTIQWVKNKKRLERAKLKQIEDEIACLNNSDLMGYRSQASKEHLISLESAKTKLPRQKEEDWRLKIRAI